MMTLPKGLQVHAAVLEETRRACLYINLEPRETSPLQSKFGGNPYWLNTMAYPTSSQGEPLRLLAQINFNEIEESIPDFPTTGILQFFVAVDDVYGVDFEDGLNQDTFRVVYHESVETDESKWMKDLPVFNNDETYFPVESECAITFEHDEERVSANDFRFNKIAGIDELLESGTDEDDDAHEEIMEAYFELSSGQGHKLGGYPFFTQEDPRTYGDYPTHQILLLQVDTDDEHNIMWGDSGVGNFFISEQDLKNRDFSKVLYNWDCY